MFTKILKRARVISLFAIVWSLLLPGAAQAVPAKILNPLVNSVIRSNRGPDEVKAPKAMSLEQRRNQVRQDAAARKSLKLEPSVRTDRKKLEGKSNSAKRPAVSAENRLYYSYSDHTELLRADGTVVGISHRAPAPAYETAEYIPKDGEKLTLKAFIYYEPDSLVDDDGDKSPKIIPIRAYYHCQQGSKSAYFHSEVINQTATNYSHSYSVREHSVPPWAPLQPGGSFSYTFTYDSSYCKKAVDASSSNNAAPWLSFGFMDPNEDGTWPDARWGYGTSVTTHGLASVGAEQALGGCAGNSASSSHCQSEGGFGVNTATGAFGQTVSDGFLLGSSELEFSRTYTSSLNTSGPLGFGWKSAWDTRLEISDSGDALLVSEDGSKYLFTKEADGTYSPPSISHSTLTGSLSGYTLRTREGNELKFNSAGQLTSRINKQKQTTSFTYDSSGHVASIKNPRGRSASFTFSGELISMISFSDGRSVEYEYESGRLTSVRNNGTNSVSYEYGSGGKISAIKNGQGNYFLRNSYDTQGRVYEQTGPSGEKVKFAYNGNETDYTMPDGGVWTDLYSSGNVLLSKYDPYGKKTSYEYTYHLDLLRTTDARGNKVAMELDDQGNGWLTSISAPLHTERWGYEMPISGNVYSYTDGNSKRSTYTYDSSNRLKKAVDPAGNSTAYTYASNGQVQTITDPRGKTARFVYDELGNQVSVTQPDGARLTRTFDAAGRVASRTDPRGNVAGADPSKYTKSYTYDDAGRLASTKDATGSTTTRTYNTAGNLATVTDAAGKTTNYLYDEANRLTQVKDAAGRVSTTTYDVMGNVASRTDAAGAKTTYTYDKASRLLTMTTARGNIAGADPSKYTWKYGYDEVGNRVTETDPLGNTTKTDYDAENRPVAVTDPLGRVRKTEYDGEGNVTKTTDALGKTVVNTYDANNQLLTTTDRAGRTITYSYDTAGNLTSEVSPLGNKTTYGYNDNGQLVSTVEPRGNVIGADPAQYTWTTAYDEAGHIVSQTNPYGTKIITNTYDAAGRLVERADGLGKKTAYEYDVIGQLSKVTAPDQGITTLGYDDAGNLLTRQDANGHITRYGYDGTGRLNKITDPLGRATAFLYDPEGNRTTTTNARGQTITNTYDARNRLARTTYSDATPTLSYTYDAAGQTKTVSDGTGTRTFGYDLEGRPTSITSSAGKGSFTYTYDAEGRITSRAQDYTTGTPLDWSGATQTASADLNGDGITDVIRADAKNGIRTYLGRPDGSFSTRAALTGSGTGFNQLLAIDYTGDSRIDLLAIDKSTGRLYRYNGNGAGGFASPIDMGAGWATMILTAGDFNADAKQDFLATSTSENKMYFYPGKGDGTFNARTLIGGGWATYRLISLEYNSDGKLDILAVNSTDGHLYLYPGNGDGTLGARTDLGAGWGSMNLTPGDFNGDGKTDFLAHDTANRKVRFYPSTGTGKFGTFILQTDDWTSYGAPVAGRFDAGQTLDTVASDTSGRLRLWRGDNAGHLSGAIITTVQSGQKATYGYDSDGHITSQTVSGKTTIYAYDAAGNRTTTKLPTTTAVTEERTYDRSGQLASVSEGSGARYIERDLAGRVTADYFQDAGTTGLPNRYAYDAVGRVTQTCTDISTAVSCLAGTDGSTYTYDKVGNLTGATTAGDTRTNSYDAADQLTKRVGGTSTDDFAYDADGNLTKDASGTYTYDPLGHLRSATLGSNTYTFGNDADGNRTTTSKNGTLTRTTLWDVVNPLPQISTETNGVGALIADYQYNPDGIAEAQNRTTGVFYMTHDRQNSISAVYNASGKQTYSYTYSDWGVPTGEATTTGGQDSAFGYAGQYTDPTLTGRLHLRERSYDPNTGRFASPDPQPADNDSPNLSPYAYANNDPINQADPSGRCPLCVSIGVGAVIGAVIEGGIYGWQHRNGDFSWGDFAKATGQGALTGGAAGALMPGVGNAAVQAVGLSGGRALAASAVVNAGVGAGFSWAVNEAHCQPTGPWDLLAGATGGASSSLIGPATRWIADRFRQSAQVPGRFGPGAAHADDPALRGAGGFNVNSIPEEPGFRYLYRGLSVMHPGYDDAVRGIAKPRGGSASMEAHHTGNTESIYTSWDTNRNTALRYARGAAEGRNDLPGVILQVKLPLGQPIYPSMMFNSELWEGTENLVEGLVTGAKVWHVPAS